MVNRKKIWLTPDSWGNENYLTRTPDRDAAAMREIGEDWINCNAGDCLEGIVICGVARFEIGRTTRSYQRGYKRFAQYYSLAESKYLGEIEIKH